MIIKQLSIALVKKDIFEVDSLNRTEIKNILSSEWDSQPKYIELPVPPHLPFNSIGIFDYFSNPDFPVQLNFEGSMQVFILNTPDIDALNHSGDFYNQFVEKFHEINNEESLKIDDYKDVKAYGFNVSYIVDGSEASDIESFLKEHTNQYIPKMNDFVAGGIRIVKKDDVKKLRIDLRIDPMIPKIGSPSLNKYEVHVNYHIQPVGKDWKTNLTNQFQAFVENYMKIKNFLPDAK